MSMPVRLTKTEAAEYLGVTTRTLDQWFYLRKGPPRTKLGHRVFYLRDSLERWIREQEEDPEQMREAS